jgi:hypothetical protein
MTSYSLHRFPRLPSLLLNCFDAEFIPFMKGQRSLHLVEIDPGVAEELYSPMRFG